MSEPNDATDGAAGPRAVPQTDTDERSTPVCQVAWCPFCLAVGAVQPIAPEMVEHLLRAGTEMLLAFRAVIDARTATPEGDGSSASGPTRLEKIELG